MIKKLMLFMFVFVFLVGTISAFEIDNTLRYENEDMKVTIENFWGLPFFGSDLGTIELKSHTSVNHIKNVGIGKQVVMWYDFSNWELYEDGLGDIIFTDMRTGKLVDRNYTYVYLVEKQADVYGEGNCGFSVNGTKTCENIVIGTQTYEDWIPYNSRDIPKENIIIGIEVYVDINDTIDGEWTIAGKKITKHSVWSADLNVDLNIYYQFNSTADVRGNLSLTEKGAPVYNTTNAVIFDAGQASNGAQWEIAISDLYNLSRVDTSMTFWFRNYDLSDDAFVIEFKAGGPYIEEFGSKFFFASPWWGTVYDDVIMEQDTTYFLCLIHNGTDMSFYLNGVLNKTDTSTFPPDYTKLIIGDRTSDVGDGDFMFDEMGFWDRALTGAECNQLYNGGSGISYSLGPFVSPPTSTLNQPANDAEVFNQTILFNATGTDDTTVQNMSLYVNGSLQVTNSSPFNNTLTQFSHTFASSGFWNWTVEVCDDEDTCTNAASRNITFTNDLAVTLNAPANQFSSLIETIIFNATGSDETTLQNMSFILNGTYNGTNASVFNNTLTQFSKTLAAGFYNWTMEVCDNNANCLNATARNVTIAPFTVNVFTFNASSFETANETFTINMTTNGTAPTNANLIYNGTFSSATITNTAGDNYNITKTIDIPLVSGTKSWLFNFTLGGVPFNTSTQTQIINLTNFTHCVGETPVYFNISFKNETVAEPLVSAEIDSDWNFWLGAGSIFKTMTFTNVSENLNYNFCLKSGSNRTLETNVSLTYDNSISEQRSFSRAYTLTNETTNQTLFLLPTADGIFVTFQTVTVAEQIISGVVTNVTKSGNLIAAGTTDDAGLIQYFLDPDTTYVFSFFKTGFDIVTKTLKPTQTTFTVIMGSVNPLVENDTTKGISYTINPLNNVLSNNTITEFNLTFHSSFFSLDSFGFALKNSTGTFFNITTSTTGSGGFLTRTLDTANNTDIQMEVFWTIDSNQTNVTRTWKVLDTTDEGFSIKTFFDDLTTYLTSGLFGLTSFGLNIIIFLIIMITTGILSMKFSIANPAGLSIMVFAMVLFFDVGLGLITNPVDAITNFPTIFVGVIFLGFLLKEAIIR